MLKGMILKFVNLSRSLCPGNTGKIFRHDHMLGEEVLQLFQSYFLLIFKT